MALASLFAAAFPVHAQTGMEAFNPMAMLAPMMTPLGAMMVPMTAPMNNSMNAFNPATMFNPAMFNPAMFNPAMFNPAMFNPATMFNPAMFNPATMFNPAMLPGMSGMPSMPGYGAPAGMVPFTGLQAAPQAYGMPPQMANPFAGMLPFPMPAQQNQAAYPMFPGFPMPFPGGR